MNEKIWKVHGAILDYCDDVDEAAVRYDIAMSKYGGDASEKPKIKEVEVLRKRGNLLRLEINGARVVFRRAYQQLSPGADPICGLYLSRHEAVLSCRDHLLREISQDLLSSEGHDDAWPGELRANMEASLVQEADRAADLARKVLPPDVVGASTATALSTRRTTPCGVIRTAHRRDTLSGKITLAAQ